MTINASCGVTADDLVRREVYYCASTLVSTLSKDCPNGDDLLTAAVELSTPIDDWESAAEEAGWSNKDDAIPNLPNEEHYWMHKDHWHEAGNPVTYLTAQEACEEQDIEPYQREVFEHWIVSDWLADKLADHGEKVDKDFAGMTIWARTCTGQGIAQDYVIQQIVEELNTEATT